MRRWIFGLAVVAMVAAYATPAEAGACRGGRSSVTARWLSIAHPGLGEWYLKGWGSFDRAPQKKFWFGFIPVYGWPGYLQVKSAIDAGRCKTNDRLHD